MTTISNIPAALEWRVYRGDTARLTVVIKDEAGNDVDLTGYTFVSSIKNQPTDAVIAQDINITATDNILNLEIADTTSLAKVSYFDVQSTYDGTIWTILKGNIYCEQDVTE